MARDLVTSFDCRAPKLIARPGEWLSEEEMRASLPSIFAEEAHGSRSDRYTYIPTIEILRGLAKEGFKPTFAVQAKARDADMFGHTKHMIRLRRDFELQRPDVAEVVMVNSHGGQTSAQLFGGWFRFICQNGMVVGDKLAEVRVRHQGPVVDDIIEGAFTVVDQLGAVGERVDEMKQLTLSRPEQVALAEGAATVRFDLAPGDQSPVTPERFLQRRRYEDGGDDLWSTFNRVQENTMRGGLHGRRIDANGRRRNMSTREVNGIDQNVALNRALWTLAERMADLKGAGE